MWGGCREGSGNLSFKPAVIKLRCDCDRVVYCELRLGTGSGQPCSVIPPHTGECQLLAREVPFSAKERK